MSMVTPKVYYRDYLDAHGNPDGGEVESLGIKINWHRGPIKLDGPEDEQLPPNGAFVGTVIEIAIHRLEFYQSTKKFTCAENEQAIQFLNEAMACVKRGDLDGAISACKNADAELKARLNRRHAEGTLGTHTPDKG